MLQGEQTGLLCVAYCPRSRQSFSSKINIFSLLCWPGYPICWRQCMREKHIWRSQQGPGNRKSCKKECGRLKCQFTFLTDLLNKEKKNTGKLSCLEISLSIYSAIFHSAIRSLLCTYSATKQVVLEVNVLSTDFLLDSCFEHLRCRAAFHSCLFQNFLYDFGRLFYFL